MKDVSIKCDACGKELYEEGFTPHNYCLELRSVDLRKPTQGGGAVADLLQYPELESTLHLCNSRCLIQCLRDKGFLT